MSENKTLCHPASVDSLSTSAGTEDHVSMGGFAARKALRVVRNVEKVISPTCYPHANQLVTNLIEYMVTIAVGDVWSLFVETNWILDPITKAYCFRVV